MPKKPAQSKKKVYNFKKDFFYLCSCCAVIAVLLMFSFNINYFFQKPKVLASETDLTQTINEKDIWLKIIKEYPDYRDGYLELARLSVELSDKKEAQNYLEKAKQIDPNSAKIDEVRKTLGL